MQLLGINTSLETCTATVKMTYKIELDSTSYILNINQNAMWTFANKVKMSPVLLEQGRGSVDVRFQNVRFFSCR